MATLRIQSPGGAPPRTVELGDGRSTIAELIEEINRDPRRGVGHEKVLTRLEVDEQAERLMAQAGVTVETVLGAARMVSETKLPPAELTSRVTSPGGTTLAGLGQLEEKGFRAVVHAAVEAATIRSKELGG